MRSVAEGDAGQGSTCSGATSLLQLSICRQMESSLTGTLPGDGKL